MSLKYNRKLVPRAKQLRREMTPQEKHLWYDFLSSFPIRFQRQKTIDNFIVDFYCYKAKLVIEIDGNHQFDDPAIDYDKERTAVLNGLGLDVIRFTNLEVDQQFSTVCEQIRMKVMRRI